jgi:hypothetical protein
MMGHVPPPPALSLDERLKLIPHIYGTVRMPPEIIKDAVDGRLRWSGSSSGSATIDIYVDILEQRAREAEAEANRPGFWRRLLGWLGHWARIDV